MAGGRLASPERSMVFSNFERMGKPSSDIPAKRSKIRITLSRPKLVASCSWRVSAMPLIARVCRIILQRSSGMADFRFSRSSWGDDAFALISRLLKRPTFYLIKGVLRMVLAFGIEGIGTDSIMQFKDGLFLLHDLDLQTISFLLCIFIIRFHFVHLLDGCIHRLLHPAFMIQRIQDRFRILELCEQPADGVAK